MPLSNLDEIARRPDDPILILQHPDDADVTDDLGAARVMYRGFVVITCAGTTAHVDALQGRDVVLWPWQTPGNRKDIRPLALQIARVATRCRIMEPQELVDQVGPSDVRRRLNGHGSPTEWAKQRVIDVPNLPEPPQRERPPLVSDYQPHPDMIEEDATTEHYSVFERPTYDENGDEWPTPVDLFTKQPLPAFKHEYLPHSIADYVQDQSEIIGADPCMLGVSVLVSSAACLHDGIKLQAQRYNYGWKESARLWGMCIGDPSKRKTPVLSAATAQLVKRDYELRSHSAEDLKRYVKDMRSHEALERTGSRRNGFQHDPVGEPPQKPPMRALVAQDVTPEKFAVLANDNPGGLLVLRDELSGFLGGMDAYSNGSKKDGPFWLQAYNGGPWSVDRITRDSLLVSNLSACVLGGIQPSRLVDLAKTLPDDGLLQRFMPVIAQDVDSIGYDRAPIAAGLDAWRNCIDWLLREQPKDKPLQMSDEALKTREAFEYGILELQRAHAGNVKLVAHLGKWPGLFVRLCLVHHAMECAVMAQPVAGEVTLVTAKRVARFLMDYLYEHVRALYEDLDGDTGIHVDAKWIAGYIIARGLSEITEREIYRAYTRFRGMGERQRQPILRAMEFSGWLQPKRRGHAGTPITAWYVNPRVHELFAKHVQPEIDARATARQILVARRTKYRQENPNDG